MGLCMDMCLDHKVPEQALGKMTAAEKREEVANRTDKKRARGQAFCWPRGHHGRLCDRSTMPRMGS
jgi:hypothetical protein